MARPSNPPSAQRTHGAKASTARGSTVAPPERKRAQRGSSKPKGNGDKYYAWEKFGSAVRSLATSDGPWRERLRDAYTHISPLTEADMPPDDTLARADYRALVARMTWAEDKTGEGTILATLALISDREARALAGLFEDIEGSLVSAIIGAARKGEGWGEHH